MNRGSLPSLTDQEEKGIYSLPEQSNNSLIDGNRCQSMPINQFILVTDDQSMNEKFWPYAGSNKQYSLRKVIICSYVVVATVFDMNFNPMFSYLLWSTGSFLSIQLLFQVTFSIIYARKKNSNWKQYWKPRWQVQDGGLNGVIWRHHQ